MEINEKVKLKCYQVEEIEVDFVGRRIFGEFVNSIEILIQYFNIYLIFDVFWIGSRKDWKYNQLKDDCKSVGRMCWEIIQIVFLGFK